MIRFDDARRLILEYAAPLGRESRPLDELPGAFLAEPLVSRFDLPRFDNSAVDGFGVRAQDVAAASKDEPVHLVLKETLMAGDWNRRMLEAGETFKILTGAAVPPGVDAVVMREFCTESEGVVVFRSPVRQGENIRCRAGEHRAGQELLPAGIRVTPPVIGMLATQGYCEYPVFKPPRVALVTTGNEVISPGRPLEPGQIYDANSHSLRAALRDVGLSDCAVVQVGDEPDATARVLEVALANHEVVITVGGISVGDYDFVKGALERVGVRTLFWRIAIKPGKPVYFGTLGSKLVFGLPGNPVSVLVTLHQLVLPALRKMMGCREETRLSQFQGTLTHDLQKTKPGLTEFVRGVIAFEDGDCRVTATKGQDSHMLGGLSRANCLICIPAEADHLPKESRVDVELLLWG